LGDVVICFPNPDHPMYAENNKVIDYKVAEKVFDECLVIVSDDGISKAEI
jgi:hypothetical protein